MPFREKRPDEQVFSQLVPLSRPACGADWRKSARLFAYSPGVHCRDGLTAGGSRIRTLRSPVRVTGKMPRSRSLRWSGKCRRCPAPAEGCRSLQAAFLATKSSRFNSLLQEYRMTDLIKALRERREELRNELQEHPLFQEYELVCRLLERREASVSIPSPLRPKAPRRKPAPQQQPVDRPAPFTRTDKGMNAVIEASADFLRRKRARADSAEIQKELVRSGVLEDGPRDRSRITSYLGRAKAVFDNVRGEGYGLREWRTPSA